jgi:hypothetical protein
MNSPFSAVFLNVHEVKVYEVWSWQIAARSPLETDFEKNKVMPSE